MEGCDSNEDGSPSELVRRRYRRFGAGGSGLIWWEACAVVPEGKGKSAADDDHKRKCERICRGIERKP